MKRNAISLIFCSFALLALCGCSSNENINNGGGNEGGGNEGGGSEEENSKVLVAYFSASGNTKEAAELISSSLNGDLFEIEPKEEYTSADLNYSDDSSRVVREHEDPSLRDIELVTNTPANWDTYSKVFIGYPIWWGIAAWPINNFVKLNDFNGKDVIPFCTSSSSGIGESGTLLHELNDSGNWLEGRRFSSSPNESDVNEWLKTLNLID